MTANKQPKEDIGAALRNLVTQLDNLLIRPQEGPADKVSLSEILGFSERWGEGYTQMSTQMLSLLPNDQAFQSIISSKRSALILKKLIWLTALSQINLYNKSCNQQLLAAVISTTIGAKNPAFSQSLPPLLAKNQQTLWLITHQQLQQSITYQIKVLQNNAMAHYKYIVAIAMVLSELMQQYNYMAALQKLTTVICSSAQSVLYPWIERFGCLLPGMLLDPGLFVLDIHPPKVWLCDHSTQPLKPPYQVNGNTLRIAKVLPGLSTNMLGEYWQQQQTVRAKNAPEFRIDKPPASLLAIQDLMQRELVDMDEVAVAIQAEPLFAAHIQHTASDANRLNLPVTDIKHALMVQGLEKSRFILLRQALMLRLNQRYFPLQNSFVQFTQLRCQLAAQLCELSLGNSAVEEIRTLALFACGGLFTLAPLKSLVQWQASNGAAHIPASLFQHPHAYKLQDHSIKLAKAWQQPKSSLLALQQQHLYPDALGGGYQAKLTACILGLSLQLARKAYFMQKIDSDSDHYQSMALAMLKVRMQDINGICDQAMVFSHSYCPWHLEHKFGINRPPTHSTFC